MGFSIATDNEGNVYITGNFIDTVDFDPGPGISLQIASGYYDFYIEKFDENGNFLWVKTIDHIGSNAAISLTLDNSDNIICSGWFMGTVDFDPGPGIFLMDGIGFSSFILKLNSAGNFIWAEKIASSAGNIWFGEVETDNANNIYCTGDFGGTVDFDPGIGIYNLSSLTGGQIPILKLDSNGIFIWARNFGSSQPSLGYSIAIDDSGNVYSTGLFTDTADFNPDSSVNLEFISVGFDDIYLLKLNSSGDLAWAHQFGSQSPDWGKSVVVDDSSNVYLTGRFLHTIDFDPGTNTFNLIAGNSVKIFVSKYNSSGNLDWARNTQGSGTSYGNSIALDSNNNVYTTGSFYTSIDFDPDTGSYVINDQGVFVWKLTNNGSFSWAKTMNGFYDDMGNSISISPSQDIFVCGNYVSDTLIFDSDTLFSNSINYEPDIFVCRLSKCISPTFSNIDINACVKYISPSGNNIWQSSGIYHDTIFNAIGCDSIITINLNVIPVNISVSQNHDTLSANAIGGIVYQWINCDNNFSEINGATNQTYYATANGSYAVVITQNGCTDTSVCYTVTNVGIIETDGVTDFMLYPNPATDNLTIQMNTSVSQASFTLTNTLGQVVKTETVFGQQVVMNVGTLAAGIYFVQLKTPQGVTVKKVVICAK